MKKLFLKSFLAALLVFMSSCDPTDTNLAVVNSKSPAVITSPQKDAAFTINPNVAKDTITTIEWEAAKYDGSATEITYQVQMTLESDSAEFKKAVEIITTSELSKKMLGSELNAAALNAGFVPFVANKAVIRVQAYIGKNKQLLQNSALQNITVTPYEAWDNWGIVGSATPGGWDGPDIVMDYNGVTKTYSFTGELKKGDIKFRKENNWQLVNYGSNLNDGNLNDGGKDIPIGSAGAYEVTANFITKKYTIIKK